MSDEIPYLTMKQIMDEQTDQAKSYHSTLIKLYAFNEILFPVYYLLIVFLKIPEKIANTGPNNGDYSTLSIIYTTLFLFILHFIVSLPIGWMSERNERNYKFSTKSWFKWFKTAVKALLISLLFGILFFVSIYTGIKHFNENWWIFAAAVAIFFMIVMLFYPLF